MISCLYNINDFLVEMFQEAEKAHICCHSISDGTTLEKNEVFRAIMCLSCDMSCDVLCHVMCSTDSVICHFYVNIR